MKVKKLIEALQQHDPEKSVYIQQGEEYDYMQVHNVDQSDIETDEGHEEVVIIYFE